MLYKTKNYYNYFVKSVSVGVPPAYDLNAYSLWQKGMSYFDIECFLIYYICNELCDNFRIVNKLQRIILVKYLAFFSLSSAFLSHCH